ncbi:MAG: hypothetical protein NT042_08440 [Sulfuritalea sp.]|nr:hypothetical protein [Sulfuritalea sp.]
MTKTIELTVDFGALAAAGMQATDIKRQVQDAATRICEYIETKGVWPPA